MTPQELKYSILGDAFTGKLSEQIISNDFGGIKTIELLETPFDIPETWVWSTLGLCCEMYTGNSISETVKAAKYTGLKTGYDYIATKDVTFNQEICYDNGVRIPRDEGFKVAYKDAVLMCIEGGSAGRKIGILDRNVCFGNKLCSFHVRGLDNKYLFYYLQSWLFKELFSGNMTGIIGGVSIKKLKEITIPIAPLAEQKRIVAKIEELLPYIDRYEKAWSRLEDFNKRFPVDMQKSILQMAIQGKLVPQVPEEGTGEELFLQIQAEKQALIKAGKIKKEKPLPEISEDEIPFDIPESWKWVRFSDVLDVRDGTHDTPKYVTSGIPLVTSKNLVDGKIDFDTTKLISQEDAQAINLRSAVDDGDILFAMIGTIGNPVLVKKDREFCIKNMALFKAINKDLFDMKYLLLFLQNEQHVMKKKASGGVQSFVSLKFLRNYLLPLPPLAEQKRIVAKLEEILPMCERLK